MRLEALRGRDKGGRAAAGAGAAGCASGIISRQGGRGGGGAALHMCGCTVCVRLRAGSRVRGPYTSSWVHPRRGACWLRVRYMHIHMYMSMYCIAYVPSWARPPARRSGFRVPRVVIPIRYPPVNVTHD